MQAVTPSIQSFPKDGRIWRLDWLGPIRKNSQPSIEPTVDVVLSPVIPSKLGNPQDESCVDGSARRQASVGIGLLPYFRVGTLWRDRRILSGTAGKRETFENVIISPSTVRIVSMGAIEESLGPGKYLVPPFLYKVGSVGMGSKLIAVDYGGDPFGILLPAVEAIRFYYAGSSYLTYLSFFGCYELYLNSIIDPRKSWFVKKDGKCILQLRRKVHDEDAWIIGRVLNNKIARSGAKRIYDSVAKDIAGNRPAYPICGLPFEGITRWIARGLQFKSSQGKDRFLIFELTRCSAPFPFEQLAVNRDNSNEVAPSDTDISVEDKLPAWALPKTNNNSESTAQTIQTARDPQRNVKPVEILLPGKRFDALEGKTVQKFVPESNRYKSAQLKVLQGIEAEELSSGPETGGGGNSSTGSATTKNKERLKGADPSFEYMVQAVEKLEKTYHVKASMRSLEYERYKIPPSEPSFRNQWAYLRYRGKIQRYLWAININVHVTSFCFVDFEMRHRGERTAALVRRLDGLCISDEDFDKMLNGLSANNGKWEHAYFMKIGFHVAKRRHTWTNGDDLAKAIVVLLQGA